MIRINLEKHRLYNLCQNSFQVCNTAVSQSHSTLPLPFHLGRNIELMNNEEELTPCKSKKNYTTKRFVGVWSDFSTKQKQTSRKTVGFAFAHVRKGKVPVRRIPHKYFFLLGWVFLSFLYFLRLSFSDLNEERRFAVEWTEKKTVLKLFC